MIGDAFKGRRETDHLALRRICVATLLMLGACNGEQPAGPAPTSAASAPSAPTSTAKSHQQLTPQEAADVKKASKRFEDFMQFWREGGTDYHREGIIAASLWMRGRRQLGSGEELNDATHYFDRWRTDKKLLVPKITYYIQEYYWVKDHTEVDVVINGKPLRVGIPTKEMPLFWVD